MESLDRGKVIFHFGQTIHNYEKNATNIDFFWTYVFRIPNDRIAITFSIFY